MLPYREDVRSKKVKRMGDGMRLSRREFLQSVALAGALPAPLKSALALPDSCWLEVLIPFIVQDPSRGYSSEIVLPSGAFAGKQGYRQPDGFSEYEILGYGPGGKPLSTGRFEIPPMHTTVVRLSDLYASQSVLGAARVRMRPRLGGLAHFTDLFSAAFVRWNMGAGYSYVHGYPDPPQLKSGDYISILSMPRASGNSFLSVFNPNPSETQARIEIFSAQGRRLSQAQTPLAAFESRIFDVRKRRFVPEVAQVWEDGAASGRMSEATVVVSSPKGRPKVFFFFLNGDGQKRFSCEHPVLQGGFQTQASQASPFSSEGQFQAQAMVFTPLFFFGFASRGLTLDSRAYLGAGRPVEDPQWLHPFLSGRDGRVYWSSQHDQEFARQVGAQAHQGVLRLSPHQLQVIDSRKLPLTDAFAGGLGVACRPVTNHTLMKIEIAVREWQAVTYSHFRPGGSSSRSLLKIEERQGLASDYIISGIHVEGQDQAWKRDALLSVMNIEFDGGNGSPVLELFGKHGFVARRSLPQLPALACRFYWASDLFPQARSQEGPFSIRLMDTSAVSIIAAVHFDFQRRQLAVDHGSDRFSTYLNYSC